MTAGTPASNYINVKKKLLYESTKILKTDNNKHKHAKSLIEATGATIMMTDEAAVNNGTNGSNDRGKGGRGEQYKGERIN